jgi:CheY-like chemotaxis protein
VVAENTDLPLLQRPGVLVVDDDPLIRSVLRTGLERHGFRVFLATGGAGSTRSVPTASASLAVVLLDIRMPGLDGPQTLDRLRHLNPDVLACFMSGDTSSYDPEELEARGACHVFPKPFRLDDVAQRLWLLARPQGVPTDLAPSCNA